MKTNHRFPTCVALLLILIAQAWPGQADAGTTTTSVQSGNWEDTATWSCNCVPGAADTVTISAGTTVKVTATEHSGNLIVNGTFDTNGQVFLFNGTTFTNNGSIISTTGSFGEIDFTGVGAVPGTVQTIAGTGTYAASPSFPMEIIIRNAITVVPASGTVLSNVSSLVIEDVSTLDVPNTLVFAGGTITCSLNAQISGPGPLLTQGTVTLVSGNKPMPLLEVVNGTTTAGNRFGAITIDNNATLILTNGPYVNGDLTVESGGILDTNGETLGFQGVALTNNGSVITSKGGFAPIELLGAVYTPDRVQTIAGTGPYASGASFPVDIVLFIGTTVTAAEGTVIDGASLIIDSAGNLSLPSPFVFRNGAIINANSGQTTGEITGAGPLQTQGAVTLNFDVAQSPPLEVVDGTTAASGTLGTVTIDGGATMQLADSVSAIQMTGDLTIASGATFDINKQFFGFEGSNLTNNGSVISPTGVGAINFGGVNAVMGTTQHLSGAGSYGANGRNDLGVSDNITLIVADGTALNGLTDFTFNSGSTFAFTGSGTLTIGGTVTNMGTVMLNGGTTVCGDTTRIQIRSSVAGVQRIWTGFFGKYVLTDVDVQDQAGDAAITVTGGVDTGNNGANWTFAPCPPPSSLLLNISTRLNVLTNDNVLIGGFIITGTAPKKVIVRGIGPSLGTLGVAGVLADPVLELHEPDGTVVTNDNWKDTQEAEIEATTIPPTNDLESAIVETLNPGAYTAIVSGKNGGTGIGLVEAYDLDSTAASRLANISTRGFVDTGNNVMIGGFIVGGGDGGATVLVRGIGPSLATVGIMGALADPTLELHDSNGMIIATNDNWKDTQEAAIMATTIPPTNDLESAILETLAPGAYTAIVSGKNGGTGVGLVEAYNLP